MMFQAAFGVLSLLAVINSGEALRCWACSSDLDPHCADTFNTTSNRFSLSHLFTDCRQNTAASYPFLQNTKAVCKKLKQTINGEVAIIRSCAWETPDQLLGPCSQTTPSYIKVEFCETCDTDGCNGSENLKGALWAALLPVAAAIFLRK